MRFLLTLIALLTLPLLSAASTMAENERLADQAGKALKKLGTAMANPAKNEFPNLKFNLTLPNEKSVSSITNVEAALNAQIIKTKFKVIRIKESEKNLLATEQLLTIFAKSTIGFIEINTNSTATWSNTDNHLTILSFNTSEAKLAKTNNQSLLFKDITDSLVSNNSTTNILKNTDSNNWFRTLDASINPDFFALSGVTVADINNDGLDDVYFPFFSGIPNLTLYQQKNGQFRPPIKSLGLDLLDGSTSAIFVDFDNDGDQDLALATSQGVAIYAADSDGNFKLSQIFPELKFCYSLCAADFDQDGLVDLYSCQYYARTSQRSDEDNPVGNLPVPHPVYDAQNGGKNALLKNTGNLQFTDVTNSSGINQNNARFSYAAFWEDIDNDGDQDLYVANDFGQNNLYINNKGSFTDETLKRNIQNKELSMGATAADFDLNGKLDLHISNMFSSAGNRITRMDGFKNSADHSIRKQFELLSRGNSLLSQDSNGQFKDVTEKANINVGRWSWGTLAPDIDNDSYDDIIVANGFVTGKLLDDL